MKKITLLLLLFFTVYSYSQTQLLSRIDEVDIGSGTYVNSTGFNYEYDSNNNLVVETLYFWDTNAWVVFTEVTYTYNTINKATEVVYKSYNFLTDALENSDRTVYVYDGGGVITNIEDYIWESGAWVPSSRTEIFYTAGEITSAITEDYEAGLWVNTFQSRITYNSNNTIDVIFEDERDAGDTAWVLDERQVFSYYSNNKISSVKSEVYNGSAWEDDTTTSYVLDGNGNRISETETYSGGSETITYVYDTSALMSNFDNPFADYNDLRYIVQDFPHVNKILSSTSDDSDKTRTKYNYNNVLSLDKVPNAREINLKVYPNPTKDFVSVKSSESIKSIDVFSALGNIILSTSDMNLNVSQFSKGIYLMNISLDNGSTVVKRLIKE